MKTISYLIKISKANITAVLLTFIISFPINGQYNLDSIVAISHQGQYERANRLFEQRKALVDADIKSQLAQAYNYSWWGKYSQAEDLFLSAFKDEPKNPETLEGIAYNYRFSGEYPKSVQFFNMLLDEAPNHLAGHKGLIYNYLDTDRIDGASYFLKKAFQIAPYDEELYYLEGLIKIKKQDSSGARASFQQSIDINALYHPAIDQISRMVSNPSRWEITPWVGISKTGSNTKSGIRRIDLFYNASSSILLYGYWDNSLSFENNFLLQSGQEANLFGIGSAIGWNKRTSTNVRLSHWNLPAQNDLWDVRIEQNFYLTNRWRVQIGGQQVFANVPESRILSFTNEISFSDHFNLEASIFSNHNYNNASDITTVSVVPKYFFGNNIELLTGLVVWNGDDNDGQSGISFKGVYGMLSFPVIDNLFTRIIYVRQQEINNDTESLALGISLKF